MQIGTAIKPIANRLVEISSNLVKHQFSGSPRKKVALSSAQADYILAATSAQETTWLINLLKDLDLPQILPITLLEDKNSCIKITESHKHHSNTKRIEIKYRNIKHLKETGTTDLEYCRSNDIIADVLTKPLHKPYFIRHQMI